MSNDYTTMTLADVKAASTKDLVNIFNEITGRKLIKFRDRKTAESQAWKAIQNKQGIATPAPAPLAAPAKSKTKAKTPSFHKREAYESRTIELLTDKNPKRVGSRAYEKFGILMKFNGKPVGQYRAQEGKHPKLDTEKGWPATEIRWSLNLGLIKLKNGDSSSKAA